MTSVKWLCDIRVLESPFLGYQHTRAYRFRQSAEDEGEPVTRIEPRSLMVPPGVPDFHTRRRALSQGPCTIVGRAWSGWGPVTEVEFSTDGGRTWRQTRLEPAPGPHAWRRWSIVWTPSSPGEYELCCRARDTTDRVQPLEPSWNLGGYAVNSVQRVQVTVS